jgi:hypothetical protein
VTLGWLERSWLSNAWLTTGEDTPYGFQVDQKIESQKAVGFQADQFIDSPDDDKNVGFQLDQKIAGNIKTLGLEFNHYDLPHYNCEGSWLTRPWLTTAWLVPCRYANLGFQVDQFIDSPDDDKNVGFQVDQAVQALKQTGIQVEMKIDATGPVGFQVQNLHKESVGIQINQVLYNITQLRILYEFPSRGTPALSGLNWTVKPTGKPGFSQNNVNTDLIEERYQSKNGDIALIDLRCNTGIAQGAFVDTVAILNHNLTSSATVTMQGSDDPAFGTLKFEHVLTTELENMYWISPELPIIAAKHYRFLIQDTTNPDDYISIGVIVFGSSKMFTLAETFNDPVRFGKRHFKDTLETEGYTNVSNDRATRRFLGLDFKDVEVSGSNYRMLKEFENFAKTDLKCLIIPRPTQPSTFAVFSKVVQLADERHQATDDTSHQADFNLDWDESK